MASKWPKLPALDSPDELERALPEGWRLEQIENLYEQLPIGKRFDQKSASPQGSVPVIDQSEAGVIGWHDEEPGVTASENRPVVTFANHTCEMRLMRRSFSVIQNVFPLIGRSGVCDTRFLYYGTKGRVFLEEYKGHFPDYRRKWILIPPLLEQRAIACILGALDDKIELNRRMNRTLEDIARAIFKSWFVDFDPVRAKAAGQQPHDLIPYFVDLFPDAFQESELGEIPKGWKTATLSDIAKINARSWTARNHPEEVQYVDLANTKWGVIELTALLPWEKAPSRARRVVCAGDTIVATTRPGNGSYAYISQEGFTVSTGFAVLTPRKRIYQNLIYITATNPNNINRLADFADAHGGAYPGVKPSEVSDTEIVLPSNEEIIDAFETITSPIRERIESSKKVSRTLAALRDMLLPKLISGELRVKDAELIVGRCI